MSKSIFRRMETLVEAPEAPSKKPWSVALRWGGIIVLTLGIVYGAGTFFAFAIHNMLLWFK